MEYTVLYAHHPTQLIEQVNAKIKEGWEPVGGINVSKQWIYSPQDSNYWAQAMVKKGFCLANTFCMAGNDV